MGMKKKEKHTPLVNGWRREPNSEPNARIDFSIDVLSPLILIRILKLTLPDILCEGIGLFAQNPSVSDNATENFSAPRVLKHPLFERRSIVMSRISWSRHRHNCFVCSAWPSTKNRINSESSCGQWKNKQKKRKIWNLIIWFGHLRQAKMCGMSCGSWTTSKICSLFVGSRSSLAIDEYIKKTCFYCL